MCSAAKLESTMKRRCQKIVLIWALEFLSWQAANKPPASFTHKKKSLNAPFIYLSRYQKCLAWIPNTPHKQWPFVTRSPNNLHVGPPAATYHAFTVIANINVVCVLFCFLFFLGWPRANFKSRSAGVCFSESQKDKKRIAHSLCRRGQPASALDAASEAARARRHLIAMDFRLLKFLRFDVAKRWASTKKYLTSIQN